jgi:homoserine O-succinyltransferase
LGFDLIQGQGTSDPGLIHIGLVNNMPDGALQSTERQFLKLLNLAARDRPVLVSFFALSGVARSAQGQRHIDRDYSDADDLVNQRIDGLIVTGAEPKAPELTGESYWPSLTRVIDWAEQNTHSSIWSCLAAHAAVLRRDGVRRRRFENKSFGIFEYFPDLGHPLTAGLPAAINVPHSRWNDVSEDDLKGCGHRVLTRSNHGVDAFAKQRNSLFLFFQGHPEYESDTLLLEYLRDIGRYLSGERVAYPPRPHGYLNEETAAALTELRERVSGDRREQLLAVATAKGLANTWQSAAVHIYGNWLTYLEGAKERQPGPRGRSWIRRTAAA